MDILDILETRPTKIDSNRTMRFKDSTLQIFLTIYYGSLLTTFLFDYIVRNSVRMYYYGYEWDYASNIIMGALFGLISIWAVMSVWSKVQRNLNICLFLVIIIFVARLAVGIPETMNKQKRLSQSQFNEELIIFITQMIIHLGGVVATYILANN